MQKINTADRLGEGEPGPGAFRKTKAPQGAGEETTSVAYPSARAFLTITRHEALATRRGRGGEHNCATQNRRATSALLRAALLAATLAGACPPALAQVPYAVRIEGAPAGLSTELNLASELKKGLREHPTRAALRRAATQDAAAIRAALSAAGYYAASVEASVSARQSAEDGGDGERETGPRQADPRAVDVVLDVTPGPLFFITEYRVLYADAFDGRPAAFDEAGVKTRGAADGASLRLRQLEFLNHLLENGYPDARIISRRAVADFETGTAAAVFTFESGPKARFGEISFEGLEKTRASYLRRLDTWETGEDYDQSKLAAYRDRLAATGLFSTIDPAIGARDENGLAPVTVRVAERRRRTIGAGASFSTDEGPGGRLFFENRNLFGRGEDLRIEARASELEQSLNFNAGRPAPRLQGELFANVEFLNETTDAFDARTLAVAGGFSRRWLDNRLETRTALAFETSSVESQAEARERNYFVSSPLSIAWNSENDLLNPTRGVGAAFTVTPYTGSDTFVQSTLASRGRVQFGADDRFTLAGRGLLGATIGDALLGLPRNKRYFAGGGGSVRGFGFQEAGPLDSEGDPLGGRSLIEGAAEARANLTRTIQLAAFVDAGSVSSSPFPNFTDEFFIGYGGGVRYFTPIGPIRVDAAFPLDRREADRAFQLYIALGQAF